MTSGVIDIEPAYDAGLINEKQSTGKKRDVDVRNGREMVAEMNAKRKERIMKVERKQPHINDRHTNANKKKGEKFVVCLWCGI